MKRILGIAIASIFLASCASKQPEQYGSLGEGGALRPRVENQAEELGQVHWGRSPVSYTHLTLPTIYTV